eukprot:982778-Pelagomonas_calceolata.AAC.6
MEPHVAKHAGPNTRPDPHMHMTAWRSRACPAPLLIGYVGGPPPNGMNAAPKGALQSVRCELDAWET